MNKPVSLRDLTIFMTSFISSFKIINVVIRDPKTVADTAAVNTAVNSDGIKTLS